MALGVTLEAPSDAKTDEPELTPKDRAALRKRWANLIRRVHKADRRLVFKRHELERTVPVLILEDILPVLGEQDDTVPRSALCN